MTPETSRMRLLHLAIALTLVAPAAAQAQGSRQQMLDLAKQTRATAEQMKGQLPPEEIADMLRQADEIEQGAREGGFDAPASAEPEAVATRIANAHGGRLDWLAREVAGYGADALVVEPVSLREDVLARLTAQAGAIA